MKKIILILIFIFCLLFYSVNADVYYTNGTNLSDNWDISLDAGVTELDGVFTFTSGTKNAYFNQTSFLNWNPSGVTKISYNVSHSSVPNLANDPIIATYFYAYDDIGTLCFDIVILNTYFFLPYTTITAITQAHTNITTDDGVMEIFVDLNNKQFDLTFAGIKLNENKNFRNSCDNISEIKFNPYVVITNAVETISFDSVIVEYENQCIPNWSCSGYGVCNSSDLQPCNSTIDNNVCNESYAGDYSEFSPLVCDYCTPNWQSEYTACQTNDSMQKTYTDLNTCGESTGLPIDNGTWSSCNYCNEDIWQIESACYPSGEDIIKDISYTDNNYFTCCGVTGILSDCSIDYSPYNTTTQENCSLQNNAEFTLELDSNVFVNAVFGDKVYGSILLNDSSQTYACQSYIKSIDGDLLQTNPQYEQKELSLISLSNTEYEDREFFVTDNGLAVVYWTKDNLIIDGKQHIFGVECSGNETKEKLTSEKYVSVGYKKVNEPITRMVWFNNNATNVVLFFIGIFILIGIIFLGIKIFKQK